MIRIVITYKILSQTSRFPKITWCLPLRSTTYWNRLHHKRLGRAFIMEDSHPLSNIVVESCISWKHNLEFDGLLGGTEDVFLAIVNCHADATRPRIWLLDLTSYEQVLSCRIHGVAFRLCCFPIFLEDSLDLAPRLTSTFLSTAAWLPFSIRSLRFLA